MSQAKTSHPAPGDGASGVPGAVVQYPASSVQQHFWVMDRLEPGDSALNVAVRWRLDGDLSVAQIEKAFEIIVARHEPLRTCFLEEDGEPIQNVLPSVVLHVASIDLTVLSAADAAAECDRIARAEARTPFNTAKAPLVRVTHVQVRRDNAVLLLTAHHTICDGWSIGLLARELGEICEAMQAGRQPNLPELPITYGEFCCWQRASIAEGALADDIAYWSRTLGGMEYFELPPDRAHRKNAVAASSIHSLLLDRALTDDLQAFARRHGGTLFMTALAALLTVLHRYTGATDIALGTQVVGRGHVELENLVGPFINTLVLRTDVSGDPAFSELMGRVRDGVTGALEHQGMPLEKTIEILKPRRQAGRNPLFSINLIFQRSFIENADHGTFRLIDLPSFSAGPLYDLNFFMVERPEGWRISCEYNRDLYDIETVEQLTRHVVHVFRAAIHTPDARLSRITLLDAAERSQLVVGYNDTATDYPKSGTLPRLFDRQAALTPTAAAVTADDTTLSYRDVQRLSRALAWTLQDRGIGLGSRVGVFVRRSADLVVAPLGILQSGAAYVPLDPLYPADRLAQIIEQSGLAAIVAQSGLALPKMSPAVPVVTLDGDDLSSVDDAAAPLPDIRPDDTAYVIFTSGSTGRPKGVQITHGALTNFLCAMRRKPGLGAGDRLVAVTTICFDIAALELFLPLTVGAEVVIANDDVARDGWLLSSLLQRSGATVLQATPATWRLLIEAGWQGHPRMRMLCGGEALPRHLADQLLERGAELWNMYGPTETTIWSSVLRLGREQTPVPLGPPIDNTQFYIVDQHGEPVPLGATGELLIGGDGVAAGYWDMPEATNERFVPDRFGGRPGARVYRTGDLVRMRRDGTLQFLGRADNQVKVRGFRIELGEIETVLLRHKSVRYAVAHAGADAAGETAIHAYVELDPAETSRGPQILAELDRLIAQALPRYMRPAAIVDLQPIPRLPNGKVDRNALPRSVPARAAGARAGGSTDIDPRLREIWCSVLGLQSVDDTADFFDLGGHSLIAARLLARVEATFGCRIGLAALLDAASLAEFAKLLPKPDGRIFDFRKIVRQPRHGAKHTLFAINNTGIYTALSRRLGDDLDLTALQIFDPSLRTGPLPESIEDIAGQYLDTIRQLQPEGPYTFLGWCNGGAIAFEMARQLPPEEQAASRVVVIDTWIPGYLKRLGWPRAKLAEYSYRCRQVLSDWADARTERKGLSKFLAGRRTLQKYLRRSKAQTVTPDPETVPGRSFDRWLVTYLDRLLTKYVPKPFAGRITVFRSAREPAGRFLDPLLGWTGFASGVELVVIPGDHYSVFDEPGLSVMASYLQEMQIVHAASVPADGGATDRGCQRRGTLIK